jgi:competence protein ComEC
MHTEATKENTLRTNGKPHDIISANRKNIRWMVLALFFIVNIFIWSVVFRVDRQGVLTVAFLDVGQGDAIYIEAPNGNQILIDGGPGTKTLRSLGKVMPFYDRSLDLVVATHPDQDHIGGLPAVLERMNILGVMTGDNPVDTGAYAVFEKIIDAKNIVRVFAHRGEKVILDEGVTLEILFPDRSTAGWETNTGSIVALLAYGEDKFLLTGDSPSSIEHYLVGKDGSHLQANILKLGHHGSLTSSSREFLSVVDPEYAVVSAGKDNKYGHPSKDVVSLLGELKIPILSTIDKGTIIFETKGSGITVK